MKLDNLSAVISTALAATAINLLSATNPAAAASLIGLDTNDSLVFFDSSTPGNIANSLTVTGLQSGETLLGIDFRPATKQLFGLGSSSRLYALDTKTGVATSVGSGFSIGLSGTNFGVDFNPVVDRLRVVSDADQNLRINPNTGAIVDSNLVTPGIQPDGSLAYAAGDVNAGTNPNVVASAYTNNFDGTLSTTLYGIDSNLDVLVTQIPPNAGTLNTVGSLDVDFSNLSGFDILTKDGVNTAFAASGSTLYTINLNTGAATSTGTVGDGSTLKGLAAVPVPEPTTVVSLLGLGIFALFNRSRHRAKSVR